MSLDEVATVDPRLQVGDAVSTSKAAALVRPGRRGIPPWVSFLARRIGGGLIVVFVVSMLAFICTRLLPGDAAEVVLGRNATPEALADLRTRLGADDPMIIQYFHWLGGVLTGDLGDSAVALAQAQSTPSINATIATPLENTAVLTGITTVLLVPLILLLGAIAGMRADKVVDHAISVPAMVVGGLPEFIVGSLLISVFFNWLGWFPPVALLSPGVSPLADPSALVLPILTLLIVTVGPGLRQVRASVIQTQRRDFVLQARLNGVASRRVTLRYVLRNSLAPSVQTIAQTLLYLAGGIIIVEALFAYPGIGTYLLNAVLTRDTNQVLAASVILAVIYSTVNVLADIVVVLLVPRLRTELR